MLRNPRLAYPMTKVRAGSFADPEEARRASEAIRRSLGYAGIVVEE